MKLFVKVRAQAKQERIVVLDETHFQIWVTKPAIDGKANEAVVKLLARHLNIPPSHIALVRGNTSREKCFEY